MHSTFYRRCFQIITAAILGYALYKLLNPLFGMIGWAVVLAFVLHPLHENLTRRLKGRRSLSAGILTALTPFFVLVPLSAKLARPVAPCASRQLPAKLNPEWHCAQPTA